jgi:hypothetical protein
MIPVSGSNLHVWTPTEGFVAHCVRKAEALRNLGLERITGASVAYLLKRSMTAVDDRCRLIARILKVTGSHDGIWHHVEVIEAYRLRSLSDQALAALDPEPLPAPAPVLPQFQELAAFSRMLEERNKTQSASHR